VLNALKMKKIYIIILCLILSNCGVKKEVFSQRQDISDLIKNNICVVSIPENWVQVFDVHKFLFFTPKKFKDNTIKNRTSIFRYANIGEETLQSIADKHVKMFNTNHKIEIKNISTEQTKFGETLIYKIDQYWNSYHLVNQIRFFKIEDNVYVFNYKSFPIYFEEYLPKVNFIYDNLVIKSSH
jgi:hypothetical protein